MFGNQPENMAPSGNITSVRIVNVDHYMHHPVPELDPCYSEFRGTSVSKVPVIRVFGTDVHGTKSCVHVHGVFPYLYIPFDEHSTEDGDRFTYQVAVSLDKAINISLGQTHSEDEHVFKVVHVKAIPFYGFHAKEHQFLKIYLYNPHFVRRAANLFQNGAILGKVYQPHESHVPYILQFMIDYNLYGMSFLHVPGEVVRFRKSPNETISDEDPRPFLTHVERTSVSQKEIDINAAFILNRLDIKTTATQTDHENPGIASIWKDEQVRRSRKPNANYPVLEVPMAEYRPLARPTESEQFYRDAISNKLSQADDSQNPDESTNITMLNATGANDLTRTKSMFNLRQILNNSVYPSECSQHSSGTLLNASHIVDHHKKRNAANGRNSRMSILQSSLSLDETLVDEDIVNSLSQKRITNFADVTLNESEFEILDVMERLEANENEFNLDKDSILATLSQADTPTAASGRNQASHNDINESQVNSYVRARALEEAFINSDDDLNDFSMCLEDSLPEQTENTSKEHTEHESEFKIPQIDGVDDLSKLTKGIDTPRKSVRSRYPELNITVCQSPKKAGLDKIIDMLKDKNEVSLEPISKRPRLSNPSHPTPKTNGVIDLTLSDDEDGPNGDLPADISFIACRMVPGSKTKPTKTPTVLKTLSVGSRTPIKWPASTPTLTSSVVPTITKEVSPNNNSPSLQTTIQLNKEFADIISNAPCVKLLKLNLIPTDTSVSVPIQPKPIVDKVLTPYEPTSRYSFRSRVPRVKPVTILDVKANVPSSRPTKKKRPTLDEIYENTKCEVSRKYDILHNFFPEPGPSQINYYENMDLSAYFSCASSKENQTDEAALPTITNGTSTPTGGESCVISTLLRAPTFDEVLDAMPDYNIPYCEQQEPFYSNCDDATSRKEITHSTVLHIPIKSHKNVEPFVSDLVVKKGIDAKQKTILNKLLGTNPSPRLIRSMLSREVAIAITAIRTAPTIYDAELWLGRNVIDQSPIDGPANEESPSDIDADSPAKVQRERAKVVADDQTDEDAMDADITTICSSPEPDRNGSPSVLDVICLDDDDQDLESSQIFENRAKERTPLKRRAARTLTRGQVSVNQSTSNQFGSSESLADYSFGISGVSLENTFGFKMDLENFQSANANLEYNYLTILSLEIHVRTRGALNPDPQYDEIICLFYNVQNNYPECDADSKQTPVPKNIVGVIINEDSSQKSGRVAKTIDAAIEVQTFASERELILALVRLITKWDPDIFAGYEIEMASWGYVLQRGQTLNMNLPSMMSRIPKQIFREAPAEEEWAMAAEFGGYTQFEVKLSGRIFLDVWRLMRSEIALTSYTFESVMFHIMHRRCPLHGFRDLTRWWGADTVHKGSVSSSRWIVLEYFLERVKGNLELLNQLDLIGRTCEMAKLFGIQFFEVLSRGSQFRVESMMLRIAKPKNIIPVSPSVQQRAHMRAPEYLPLILEPISRFYTDSIIVLDFQSLYPSMIIAYNYCFSTCLGRVEHLGQSQPFEFGASQLRISLKLLRRLVTRDLVTFSPCGAVFVKGSVREGVLPRMLKEILDTRLMVKQSMKLHRGDALLQRVLHSRQLGLKLMANVTYGYTAANFSGRMPCVEVGDSVVSKGRETLERAIKMVGANKTWRSRVIYGDTDSLFVLVPGRTREDAFKIGAEIAEAVTQDNPHPVKLKLEKIYQPSILQTKKRYVGYMYETNDQAKPIYEAKGIETVRRDGCPAVAKMLEKTLKILFETRDVSKVKSYVCRQFTKIQSGKANLQDFIFAKEFRGTQGYKPGACVPSLELTRKWLTKDPRSDPRRGERVPYLVVHGPPGVPLIRLVRSPHEFLADPGLKINSLYYITKAIIPPLNRCLLLIGADAAQWFSELPRKVSAVPTTISTRSLRPATLKPNSLDKPGVFKKSTISQYFSTTSCPTDCGAQVQTDTVCTACANVPQRSVFILSDKMSKLDRKRSQVQKLCASCCCRSTDVSCRSLDCPVLYVLNDCIRQYEEVAYLRQVLVETF